MKLTLNSPTAKLRVDATRSELGLPVPPPDLPLPDPPPPMSAKHQQWHQVQRVINTLVLTYPVFRKRKPLAIGIHEVIRVTLGCDEGTLRCAMRYWCSPKEYLVALRNGGTRFALDGSPAGEVTPEQMAAAAAQLTTMQKKGTKCSTI